MNETMSAADRLVAQAPAYSVIHIESGYARLMPARARVTSSAFWIPEDASDPFAFIIFDDEASVDRVNLRDLSVERRYLGSLAVDVGQVATRGMVWINQEHPLGRLSFWNLVTHELLTLTGFELNRRVQ